MYMYMYTVNLYHSAHVTNAMSLVTRGISQGIQSIVRCIKRNQTRLWLVNKNRISYWRPHLSPFHTNIDV